MRYDASTLRRPPCDPGRSGALVGVTPGEAGWDLLHFEARRLAAGDAWSHATGEHELALVVFGGTLSVDSDRGHWSAVGGRADVFDGLPHALYLPRRTAFVVTATSGSTFAVAWAPTDRDHDARVVTPAAVEVEVRGGDNATRQVNHILPPGFPCHRLVVVEVYTPSGGWSSYPPHKHDVHRERPDGVLLEADLEEVYYYRISPPEGFALQRIYTDEASPLHRAGHPIDAPLVAHDGDLVLVPEGYHPVASAPGYTTYYLNVLAGSARSLANAEDPALAWVKERYTTTNPAVPVYAVARP